MLVRGPAPLARSRAQQFDELVAAAVEHLEERWAAELESVDFAVEDVPPVRRDSAPDADSTVSLGRLIPARGDRPAAIVIYRRPIELRAVDRGELADLVHDVVVEQVARLLGVDPEAVDPYYGEES